MSSDDIELLFQEYLDEFGEYLGTAEKRRLRDFVDFVKTRLYEIKLEKYLEKR